MLTVFAITIVFSSTVPLVTVAASLFLLLKHLVDCLHLLTFFRKEIDSSGRLISSVTNSALIFVLIYQVIMMAFFGIKGKPTQAVAIMFILVFTVFFTAFSYEEVYDLSKIDESNENMRVFNEEAFAKWK